MYSRSYLGRVLIAIDQLGNALSGGNPDATISARLGWLHYFRRMWWTTILMHIVDVTFLSVDGYNHCYKALSLESVNGRDFFRRGSDVGLALMSVFVIVFCIALIVPVWIYALVMKLKTPSKDGNER